MCHYQQYSHTNPYWWPGLQDITAHVDFTTLAEAALNQDLTLAGYTTQSHFLLACGIMDLASNPLPHPDVIKQYHTSQQLKKLLLPSEMGELFKVMAFTRKLELPLVGFQQHDMRHHL